MSYLIANRYAKAWFLHVKEHPGIVKAVQEAHSIIETFQHQELQEVLFSPLIKMEIKKNILEDLFKSKIDAKNFDFLMLLLKKKRLALAIVCCQKLIELQQDQEKIQRIKIKTAQFLSEAQKEKIIQKIKLHFPKIAPTYQIDPWMIGGLVLEIEGKQLDQSVRTQLKNIHHRLIKNIAYHD